MGSQRRRSLAYLLRLWDVSSTDGPRWRASVEDAHTGERIGFADLAALYAFLVQQMAGAGSGDAAAPDSSSTAPPCDSGTSLP